MQRSEISVCFDGRAYSVLAVKKAAYRFIDKFAARIEIIDGKIECFLSFDQSIPARDFDQVVSDFEKEVLDQDLREVIKNETEAIRNLILAHAFSNTGLIKHE